MSRRQLDGMLVGGWVKVGEMREVLSVVEDRE